jgi:prepilin-type N-terminal cleavage/methylation domain-containing protein
LAKAISSFGLIEGLSNQQLAPQGGGAVRRSWHEGQRIGSPAANWLPNRNGFQMKIEISSQPTKGARQSAFTLIEVMAAVAIIGIEFVSLYVGMTQGFGIIQIARENLRAAQILQEKMETIRLYTWSQVTSNGFIPTNFQATFYPAGSRTNQGVVYNGTLTITDSPISSTTGYNTDLKLVLVQLNWTSGNVLRQREMRTMVSHYGLHNYIYKDY